MESVKSTASDISSHSSVPCLFIVFVKTSPPVENFMTN